MNVICGSRPMTPFGVALAMVLCCPATGSATDVAPGVVVAPGGSAVLTAAIDGRVAALAPDDGRERWQSEVTGRPLIVENDVVLIQVERLDRGRLELATLELASGATLATFVVQLDPEVRARVADGLGESFNAEALSADGQLFVLWEHRAQRVQGIAPPEGEASSLRVRTGVVRVDLLTGAAVVVDRGAVPESLAPEAPAAFRSVLADERLAVAPCQTEDGVWSAVVSMPGPQGATQLVLRRWHDGERRLLEDVALWVGKPLHVWSSRTGGLVAVAERTHPGERNEYTWFLFELSTGEGRGPVRSPVARAAVAELAAGRVLTVQPPEGRLVGSEWQESPRRLVAFELQSGAEAWQGDLRDLGFRGPFPP